MDINLKTEPPAIRLRAFRAIDEPETCELFVEGHAQVLSSIGVTKVTSSKNEWMHNPAVFVIVVEALDGQRIYGGARVHVSGGTQPLPIEEATAAFDATIFDIVWNCAQQGTGEVCGLWNSRELAGYGIGSPLLIRAGIAICDQIGLTTLFALCAPYTVKPVVHCGVELIEELGNKGTFYYPKLDLIATAMLLKDVQELGQALDEDKAAITQMRENPSGLKYDEFKQREISISFDLKIPHMDKWNLRDVISLAMKNYDASKVQKEDINFF